MLNSKELHERRKKRLRYKLLTSNKSRRPRLCVHRTNLHTYAQIVDDQTHKVLVMASTLEKDVKSTLKNGANKEAASFIGRRVAQKALEKGIKSVIFDRSGFLFHGRIKSLADGAKEVGLEF